MLVAEQVCVQIWMVTFISKLLHNVHSTAVCVKVDAKLLWQILWRTKKLPVFRKKYTHEWDILENPSSLFQGCFFMASDVT